MGGAWPSAWRWGHVRRCRAGWECGLIRVANWLRRSRWPNTEADCERAIIRASPLMWIRVKSSHDAWWHLVTCRWGFIVEGRPLGGGHKKAPSLVSKRRGKLLATSYFRTTYRSTIIGAAAFHFRVRNGNGWGHCARITRVLRRGQSGCLQIGGPICKS